MMNVCHSLHVCTPRVNPKVNHGFWVIMMCHCRFINYNKYSTLEGDVDTGRGTGSKWEISVSYTRLCCNPKAVLKKIVHWEKRERSWVWTVGAKSSQKQSVDRRVSDLHKEAWAKHWGMWSLHSAEERVFEVSGEWRQGWMLQVTKAFSSADTNITLAGAEGFCRGWVHRVRQDHGKPRKWIWRHK